MKVLKIIHDDCPENPIEVFDGNYPTMTGGNSRMISEDYSNGDIDDFLTSYLTLNQITKHQTKILNLIDVSKVEFNLDYPLGEWTKKERADVLDSRLNEWICESIDNRIAFCEVFNIKHYSGTSQGYSQGDWNNVFICWTPEFSKLNGVTYENVTETDMKDTFDLYGYWAWGDCYGFKLIEKTECDCCGGTNENDIDSCWEFFGSDHFKSGLADHVRSHFEDLSDNEFKEMINDIEIEY